MTATQKRSVDGVKAQLPPLVASEAGWLAGLYSIQKAVSLADFHDTKVCIIYLDHFIPSIFCHVFVLVSGILIFTVKFTNYLTHAQTVDTRHFSCIRRGEASPFTALFTTLCSMCRYACMTVMEDTVSGAAGGQAKMSTLL